MKLKLVTVNTEHIKIPGEMIWYNRMVPIIFLRCEHLSKKKSDNINQKSRINLAKVIRSLPEEEKTNS
jgi:hypothetical protein